MLEESVNTGLIVGGLVTFGTMYAVSIGYASSEGFEQGLGWVALPIFGPWIALAHRDFQCNVTLDIDSAEECQTKVVDEAATLAVLAGLGIGQMVGGVLTLVGVLDRDALWVRQDVLGARLQLDMRPMNADLGLRLHGSF